MSYAEAVARALETVQLMRSIQGMHGLQKEHATEVHNASVHYTQGAQHKNPEEAGRKRL